MLSKYFGLPNLKTDGETDGEINGELQKKKIFFRYLIKVNSYYTTLWHNMI
jgi:hypothetical protein